MLSMSVMTPRHRKPISVFAVVASALLVVAAASPAVAAVGKPEPIPAGLYCVTQLEQPERGGTTRVVRTDCFDSYADSLFVATGGRLRVSEDFQPQELTQTILDSAKGPSGVLTNWVIGQDWPDENRGGSPRTYTVSTSDAPCNGRTWEIDQLDLGWDTIISSGEGFSGCDRFEHWELAFQGGSVRTCQTYCATMGVMNDQTSSLRWRD